MNEKDAYIEHLENTIKDLQNQVNNLTEMILLLRKEKFGSKSEKTPQVDGQLSLFNEAEVEAGPDDEPIIERKGSLYKRNRKTSREVLLKDLPVEEVPCIIHPDDMYCDRCGTTLKEIGFVKVRDELEYIPAKVKIIRYMQQACECPKCKHKGIPFIRKAFTLFIVKYNYRKLQPGIGECCISKLEKVAKHSLKALRNGVAPEW